MTRLALPVVLIALTVASKELTAETSGPFAFIPNAWSDTIEVIDTVSDTSVTTIMTSPVQYGPQAVAVSRDQQVVVVGNKASHTVTIIDGIHHTVRAIVRVSSPYGVALTSDGQLAIVTDGISNQLFFVDVPSVTVLATMPLLESRARLITISQDNRQAYVSHELGKLTIVDIESRSAVCIVKLDMGSAGVAVSSDKKIYVANVSASTISVVDASSCSVESTIVVGSGPRSLALSRDEKLIFITFPHLNEVWSIDRATQQVLTKIQIGNQPWGISIHPTQEKTYVTLADSNELGVIDLTNNSVTKIPSGGLGPLAEGVFIAPPNVRANLVLRNQTIPDTRRYEAIDSIQAGTGFTIAQGGNVTFLAGREIRLTDGFRAERGSDFHASIGLEFATVTPTPTRTPTPVIIPQLITDLAEFGMELLRISDRVVLYESGMWGISNGVRQILDPDQLEPVYGVRLSTLKIVPDDVDELAALGYNFSTGKVNITVSQIAMILESYRNMRWTQSLGQEYGLVKPQDKRAPQRTKTGL